VMWRVAKIEMNFFIAMEGESLTIRGGWPAALVWIQYFGFR
jgi:hypothetical protein